MNKELLKMQKLAGIITESQYKEKLNEVATTPDFSKKITISKRADASRVNDTLKDIYPSGREDIDKRNLAKSIFEKVKASSDGLTVSEIAKALKVEENEVKDLMSELSSKSIFYIEKSSGRPTINEAEGDLVTLLYSLRNSINSENKEESLSKLEDILSTVRDMEDAQLNEIEGDDYYGYNEPMSQKDINKAYAEDTSDPYINDKIAYVANALQGVWNMGKGNNKIQFDDMAEGIIDDLETRF